MAETKIFKVSALPQALEPNGIYLVSETPGVFSIKVANSAGDGILNQESEISAADISDATALGKELLLATNPPIARLALNALGINDVLELSAGPFSSVMRVPNYFVLFNPVVLGTAVPGAPPGTVWTAGMQRHCTTGTVVGAVAVLQADGSWVPAFDPSQFVNVDWTIAVASGVNTAVHHFSRRNNVTTFVSSVGHDTSIFGTDASGQAAPLSDKIGVMFNLTTTDKASLVSAINEVNNKPSGEFYPADEVFRINYVGEGTTEVEIGTQIPGMPSGTLWAEGMLISPNITESAEDNEVLSGGTVGYVWVVNSDNSLSEVATPTTRLSDSATSFDRILVFPTKGTYLYSCRGTDRRVLKLSSTDTSSMRHTEGGVSQPLAAKIDSLINNWRLGDNEYFNIVAIGDSTAVVLGDQVPGAPEGVLWAENMLVSPDPGAGLGESPGVTVGTVYRVTSDGTLQTVANPTIRNSDGSDSFNRIYNFLYKGVYLYTCRNEVTRRIYKLSDKSASGLLYTGADGFPISIEEKIDEIGDLADLDTTDKTSIVNAINEVRTTGAPDWNTLANRPVVVAAGEDAAAARLAIGAGTSNLALGTTVGTALEGNTSFITVNGTSVKGSGNLEVGYRNIPQNSKSDAYTLVLADAGCHIFHPAADTTARIFTIPANASVPYEVGTAITFVNQNGTGGVVTIAITTDTMRLAGAGTTGSRTLARNGVATAVKITSTEWVISGTGLT